MRAERVSFDQALAASERQRRHLLLGNGFSISVEPRFFYETLYDVAIGLDRSVAFLFNRLGVRGGDFEAAIALADEDEREQLRNVLLRTIAFVHPRSLGPQQLLACGCFLEAFVGVARPERGKIFTTNYDLLLYRVLISNNANLDCQDAFDSEGYWHPHLMPDARVYYWHGALHVFMRRTRPLEGSAVPGVTRYLKLLATPSEPLLPKIRRHLAQDDFPIFVAQGSAEEKQRAIGQHGYLSVVRRRFRKESLHPGSVLFTVGHSLSDVDKHIADAIASSGLLSVYIGCFGDTDWSRADKLAQTWEEVRRRSSLIPLSVYAFDIRDCRIWN